MKHINDKAAIDYNAPHYSDCVTVLQPCKAYADPLLGWDWWCGGPALIHTSRKHYG